MKRWTALILSMVLMLTGISSGLAAELPVPDPSQKPSSVTVNVWRNSDGHLMLTVSDGGKDYDVSGSFMTGEDTSNWTSFSWDGEKNAYVSSSAFAGFTGEYRYVRVYDFRDDRQIERRIGGSSGNYSSYVRVSESKDDKASQTHSWKDTTWYEDGRASAEERTAAYDSQGREISRSSQEASYDENGKLTHGLEQSIRNTWKNTGRTEVTSSTETNSAGNVTNARSTAEYDKAGIRISAVTESTTRDRNGKLISEGKESRDQDGRETRTEIGYSTTTGKMTRKTGSTSYKDTYSSSSEYYNASGVMTGRYYYSNNSNTSESGNEYFYNDGSLRMKESSKSVKDGYRTTITGARYNSNNELVFSISGTRTYDPEVGDSSRNITYTDASGARIGWDYYDAKTGREESKKPGTYSRSWNEITGEEGKTGRSYSQSGDVEIWRTYSYDPFTGRQNELITNYKGLKIYESSKMYGNGSGTEYWLRTQKPYEVTVTRDSISSVSYRTTRGLEWKKAVEDDLNGTRSYYNSLGVLTYQYRDGKYYTNRDGKLEELEEGLEVRTGERYNVTGFSREEDIENGYREIYYDLNKKVLGSYEYTSITKDGTTTETTIEYDADGKEIDRDISVRWSEETEKGRKSTWTRNGVLLESLEYTQNDSGYVNTAKYYSETTGKISREETAIHSYAENITDSESRYYDSLGNLNYVYKYISEGENEKFQELDGNEAVISTGTRTTDRGHRITRSFWAVGGMREFSDWYRDGLSMPDVYEVGSEAMFDENGRYTYWRYRDADGNSHTWDYYEGNRVSRIEDIVYNSDGSKSTHVQNFNADGSTRNWFRTDTAEDNQYVTEWKWDGDSVLLWTEVSEATAEGKTVTLTDPYGHQKVTRYGMEGEILSEWKNYTGSNGWMYAFGEWKYIENGQEANDGWKKVNGTWYFFEDNGDMAASNVVESWTEQEDGSRKPEKVYVINHDGSWMSNPGWVSVGEEEWSYVKADGTAATGWQNIGGTWYYFNSYGYMMTGDVVDKGVTYHLNADGAWVTLNGWYQDDGFWKHYTNDVKDTGWLHDGSWYYLSGETGSMVSNAWLEVDDKWYLFDENGAMETGWVDKDGTWYYMNQDGALAEGWVQDGGWYYMTESGMVTGWKVIDGNWEYFNEDGTWSYTWGPAQ